MHPVVAELRALVRLATPIAAARIGFILLGIVDTAFVGRLGEVPLGAIGIANSLFFAVVMFSGGLIMGIDPLVSQALGADEDEAAADALWQGLWLAAGLSVPVCLAAAASTALFDPIGVEAETGHQATLYLLARLPALPMLNAYTAFRSHLEARGHTRPLVVGVALANVINVPGNVLLIFGDAGLMKMGLPAIGAPALGIVGAGIMSSIATAVQLLAAVLAARADGVGRRRPLQRALMARALRVGLPIGLQRLAEMGIFSIAGLLMARIGTRAVASHQVVLTLVTTTFMVPLGISAAAAVRVGRAVGAGDSVGARRAGWVAMATGTGCMALSAAAMLTFPRVLTGMLTDQGPVIEAAVELLAIGALFQMADGLQVVAAGSLRGLGDTKTVLTLNLVGHYAVGVPVGVGLAFAAGVGARGLWWGLFAGLTAVAAGLLLRFRQLSVREVARV